MSLTTRLSELVRACFSGIWIESQEHDDAIAEVTALCREESWRLALWDLEDGLRVFENGSVNSIGTNDPVSAVRSLAAFPAAAEPTLLLLVNFHRFLQSGEVVQAVLKQLACGKQTRSITIMLSPVVQLPVELEKHFVVVEHELPVREQLAEIAAAIEADESEHGGADEWDRAIDAAVGLTRLEAEAAFSLSLVRHGRLQPDVLWEQKAQMLKKSGLLGLHRGGEAFSGLGGLDSLKSFCLRAIRKAVTDSPSLRPRGVLLLSPPGCGKSAFAKALGNETGRPTLTLDVGSLLGSLVGESERNLRQALRVVDAMAPCVLFCDELEKALAGANGSGDSGVSARMFGRLLSWLNDHTSDVFFIGTCNDISRLPPEFARAERFDAVVFLDLPKAEQREAIWKMYLAQFKLNPRQERPQDEQWTGAEIRACCRLAALLQVPLLEAAQYIVPVAHTAAESIERLRTWAAGRCLDAERGGVFQLEGTGARRRVKRGSDPSLN